MRFLVLLAEDDPSAWERASATDRARVHEQHLAFDAAVRERGAVVAGEALGAASAARTLRTVTGERVATEGPYAETTEQLVGFYLVDVADRAQALSLAALLPGGYTIEVRETVVIEGLEH